VLRAEVITLLLDIFELVRYPRPQGGTNHDHDVEAGTRRCLRGVVARGCSACLNWEAASPAMERRVPIGHAVNGWVRSSVLRSPSRCGGLLRAEPARAHREPQGRRPIQQHLDESGVHDAATEFAAGWCQRPASTGR